MPNLISTPIVHIMFVTDTNRTFVWYPPSFTGQRQLVDITDKRWSVICNDCGTETEVINCLRANGHRVIDSLVVER